MNGETVSKRRLLFQDKINLRCCASGCLKKKTVDTVVGTTLGHRSYTNKALFLMQTFNYRLQFWYNKTDKYYTKICSWKKICIKCKCTFSGEKKSIGTAEFELGFSF